MRNVPVYLLIYFPLLPFARSNASKVGFIEEMTSPEYLSRLALSLLLFFVASYFNAIASTMAGS
jgi:ABC-type sulfate transport system permease component